jgi:hypothetical protein
MLRFIFIHITNLGSCKIYGLSWLYTAERSFMYVYLYMYMYIHIYMYTYVYEYIHMLRFIFIHIMNLGSCEIHGLSWLYTAERSLYVCVSLHVHVYTYIYMYIYVYMYMFIFIHLTNLGSCEIYGLSWLYTAERSLYVCVSLHVHVYTYIYMYTYVYEYIYMLRFIFIHITNLGSCEIHGLSWLYTGERSLYVYVSLHVHIFTYMYICIWIYMYVKVYIHTYNEFRFLWDLWFVLTLYCREKLR